MRQFVKFQQAYLTAILFALLAKAKQDSVAEKLVIYMSCFK